MTYVSVIAACFSVCAAVWYALDRRAVRNCDPAKWPAKLTMDDTVRRTKRFLRLKGWKILEPWPWGDVWVRAKRGNVYLNLVTYDSESTRLRTLVKDTVEVVHESKANLGILATDYFDSEVVEEAERNGFFLVRPIELNSVEELVKKNEERRRLASDRDALLDAAPVVEAAEPTRPLEIATPPPAEPLPELPPAPVPAPAQKIWGFLESVSNRRVWGWAYFPPVGDEHLLVEIWSGETLIGQGKADLFRQDLLAAGVGKGDHAYAIDIAEIDAESAYEQVFAIAKTGAGLSARLSR